MWACNPSGGGAIGACFCAQQTFGSCWGTGSLPGFIKIMKGTPPVSFSELTVYTSRDADLLISFQIPTYSALVVCNTNPVQLTFYPQTASATGSATWFWIGSTVACIAPTPGLQYNRIYGSVGLQGSGADLEISDTNIVAGNVYKIVNLRIGLPQSYTY